MDKKRVIDPIKIDVIKKLISMVNGKVVVIMVFINSVIVVVLNVSIDSVDLFAYSNED